VRARTQTRQSEADVARTGLLTIAEADKADVEQKIELKQNYDGSEEECEGTEDEEKE
jgi:hypothetical protein